MSCACFASFRGYLAWCAERALDPLAAQRPHVELYIRWMQEIRRYKPSTVSRRFRRPAVPAESPTLGLLGLLIFETTGSDFADLGEERGLSTRRSAETTERAAAHRSSALVRPVIYQASAVVAGLSAVPVPLPSRTADTASRWLSRVPAEKA